MEKEKEEKEKKKCARAGGVLECEGVRGTCTRRDHTVDYVCADSPRFRLTFPTLTRSGPPPKDSSREVSRDPSRPPSPLNAFSVLLSDEPEPPRTPWQGPPLSPEVKQLRNQLASSLRALEGPPPRRRSIPYYKLERALRAGSMCAGGEPSGLQQPCLQRACHAAPLCCPSMLPLCAGATCV